MIYKNPNYRKARGSHILLVSCGYCKTDIAKYQKVGRGNLLRMYTDRIIKSSIDLSKNHGALFCPNCKKQLATRVTLPSQVLILTEFLPLDIKYRGEIGVLPFPPGALTI